MKTWLEEKITTLTKAIKNPDSPDYLHLPWNLDLLEYHQNEYEGHFGKRFIPDE